MEVGEEAAEVLITGAVLDEERQLVNREAGFEIRELESGPDEGAAEAEFPGGEVGAGGAVDTHVIGEGDGLVAEFGGTTNEFLRLAGAAEEGKGGTGVELDVDGMIGLLVMGAHW